MSTKIDGTQGIVFPDATVQGTAGGGGSSPQVVALTQAAYDALPAKDPNTLYVIVG
jgi:hypothetical protein